MIRSRTFALFLWWIVLGAIAVVVRLLSTGMLETGDGVVHFQIARYSWVHPRLFLDHWGKPLFTLLSSPFAQLGHWGMTLFNALCFVGTCWAADGVLRRSGEAARWLFPPALLLVPVYGTMIIAGMTEVLFGLLTLLLFRLLWDERDIWAMAVASFMPFARPEYVAVVPFALAWVLRRKRWKALPFLLVGHVLYAVVGVFVHGDALWAFHHDPYTGAEEIYGRGPLLHFTDPIQHILGAALVWGLGFGLVATAVLWFRHRTERNAVKLLAGMALLPAFAILVVHSVLWWKGLKGSLGLHRVIATAAPFAVLFAVWPLVRLGALEFRAKAIPLVVALGLGAPYVGWALSGFLKERPLPVEASCLDLFVERVGNYVGGIKEHHPRVRYHHPQIAYYADLDPFDEDHVVQSGPLGENDLFVWDAHFAFNANGGAPDDLLADPELDLLRAMVPEERHIFLGGLPFEFLIFAKRPSTMIRTQLPKLGQAVASWPEGSTADTLSCSVPAWCFGESERTLDILQLELGQADRLYAHVSLQGEVSSTVAVVVEAEGADKQRYYWAQDVAPGAFSLAYRFPGGIGDPKNKLYIWNKHRKPFELSKFRIGTEVVLRRP